MSIIGYIRRKNRQRLQKRRERRAEKNARIALLRYRNNIPGKVGRLRSKEKIKVLFVLSEAATWKTESLYLAMKRHPEFDVMLGLAIGLSETPGKSIDSFTNLVSYLTQKGYEYTELFQDAIRDVLQPDIIFYQKPYDGIIDSRLFIDNQDNALFCHIQYAFNTRTDWWAINLPLHLKAWQFYFENKSAAETAARFSSVHGENYYVTGLPIQDELMTARETYADPWKKQDRPKKRIIWAPHHSINPENWIIYSTFLRYADGMLELARKYKDEVQFVFKPHPLLADKLDRLWGRERRLRYYDRWAHMDNSQLNEGKYIDIFKYSDAMIHDCSSFIIEYHYTQNPVMYLTSPDTSQDGLMPWAQEALDIHYKGQGISDVEAFIDNVIAGEDPLKEKRAAFYREYLIPPDGKTACENIIDAILRH